MMCIQDGETALHRAVQYGHVEVVKMLVNYGAAVDIRNKAYIAIYVHYSHRLGYTTGLI